MSEARVGRRSDLDTGEARNGRSDLTMDLEMEMMVKVATPVAVETAGATIVELMERNEHGMQSRRSEALATAMAPSPWRSRMDRTMQ
jgi:hypothetical protein